MMTGDAEVNGCAHNEAEVKYQAMPIEPNIERPEWAHFSKTKRKKLAKMERMRQRHKDVRAKKKEMARELKNSVRREAEEKMSAGELNANEAAEMVRMRLTGVKRGSRKDRNEKECELQRMRDAMEGGSVRIAVDCSFENLMVDRELFSLTKQLGHCYAANRRAEKSAHLYFTSIAGKTAESLKSQFPGMQSWPVTVSDKLYTEVFDTEELVYLTADAAETVNVLDASKVYVIGGLCDHNRYKNLCRDRAIQANVTTARLPIDEFMMGSARKVLTVNQVCETLCHVLSTGNWGEALQLTMPERRGYKRKGAPADEGEADTEEAIAEGVGS